MARNASGTPHPATRNSPMPDRLKSFVFLGLGGNVGGSACETPVAAHQVCRFGATAPGAAGVGDAGVLLSAP